MFQGKAPYFVSLCPDAIKPARRTRLGLTGKQRCANMPSPNSDTRAQVVVAYQGHPVFVCAQCATVIVRDKLYLFRRSAQADSGHGVGFAQALQDEVISKAFSGRDGRG